MNTIGNRIKLRRLQLRLTQKELAENVGISASAVTQWETDVTAPKGENLLRLAERLSCYPQWILTGKGDPDDFLPSVGIRSIPLIPWEQANKWSEHSKRIDNIPNKYFVETTIKVSSMAFALRIMNPDIIPSGPLPLPEGAIVVVEPEYGHLIDIKHKIVVVRLRESSEATLKKVLLDGSNNYLLSLESGYRPIELDDNCQIVGVVKQIIINFD